MITTNFKLFQPQNVELFISPLFRAFDMEIVHFKVGLTVQLKTFILINCRIKHFLVLIQNNGNDIVIKVNHLKMK